MPLLITPEVGIPLPINTTPEEVEDFREKARILCETVKDLVARGAEIEITEQDHEMAQEMFAETRPLNPKKVTPGSILVLEAMLSEYDREIINVSHRLRNYVTNKLILETDNDKASDRLRALELLGKISDVGLFSEKVQVEVTHRTTEDIEAEILNKISKYIDAEIIEESKPALPDDIDLDKELGLSKEFDET